MSIHFLLISKDYELLYTRAEVKEWSQNRSVVSNSFETPMDYIVHGILQARILEWVAFPFSRGSSQPRDWTQVSHIVGGFFTSWATREAPLEQNPYNLLSLNSKGILQSLHWCIEKALNFTADSPSYFLSKVGFWR